MESIKRQSSGLNAPLVSILLAVYKPNMEWLSLQLASLNDQTYSNIELIVYDDCPEFAVSESIFNQQITKFPYTLIRGEKNMGSNVAFEKLTALASGKYIAYCDQDDIWLSGKISKMVDKITERGSQLVCCDALIIDADGKQVASGIGSVHKRHEFLEGEELTSKLIFKNFVMGCASLVLASVAKSAMPFPRQYVHDHWVAIIASSLGRIDVVREPLIKYRKHGANQTGVLTGVNSRASYFKERLLKVRSTILVASQRLSAGKEFERECQELMQWMNARIRFFKKASRQDKAIMIKYNKYGKHILLFERAIKYMPNFAFRWALKLIKRGVL